MSVIADDTPGLEPLLYVTAQHSCGEGGGPLERTPSCCDFCGSAEKLEEYLVGDASTKRTPVRIAAIDTDNGSS